MESVSQIEMNNLKLGEKGIENYFEKTPGKKEKRMSFLEIE